MKPCVRWAMNGNGQALRCGNLARAASAAAFALMMLWTPWAGFAQTTKTVVAEKTTSTTEMTSETKALSTSASTDQDTTVSIALLGDKVGLDKLKPLKGPFPDIMGATTSTLGTDVSDFLLPGITLPEIAKVVSEADKTQADVTIIFCGYADEQAEVKAEAMREAILTIGADLKKRNPNMKVFIVPATTTVGALTGARIRMAAEEAGLNFVQLGTEVGGAPYGEAMRDIAQIVEGRQSQVEPEQVSSPESSSSTTGTSPASNGSAMPGHKASLEQELNRPAGATDDMSLPTPPVAEIISTSSLLTENPTTGVPGAPAYPPGGTVTKRGKDAQENINMKPLPALKAFRPQIPVPRNQVDKKEPGLSR